jgi:hypothetical protein
MCDDHVLHVVIPEPEVDKFAKKPWANYLEFTSKDTASVNVAVRPDKHHAVNERQEIEYLV